MTDDQPADEVMCPCGDSYSADTYEGQMIRLEGCCVFCKAGQNWSHDPAGLEQMQ